MSSIIDQANKIYLENFPPTTKFERAIFFSWYCSIGDCKFCYMSTQKDKIKDNKLARRTTESILAELLICKKFGWDIGFVSGGHNAYTDLDFLKLLKNMHSVTGEKFWINVGPISKDELKTFLPYTKGVVASIETINPKIHKSVCPSKPIEPFIEMFKYADELNLEKAMTLILGLGETINDFPLLESFIKQHNITKIHFYALNPQKGTIFEKNHPIPVEYQAEWIALTRISFPKLDIQCGIWADKIDNLSLLLQAGANSFSKFPVLKLFGKKESHRIMDQIAKADRTLIGTITDYNYCHNGFNIEKELIQLRLSDSIKEKIRKKLCQYIK